MVSVCKWRPTSHTQSIYELTQAKKIQKKGNWVTHSHQAWHERDCIHPVLLKGQYPRQASCRRLVAFRAGKPLTWISGSAGIQTQTIKVTGEPVYAGRTMEESAPHPDVGKAQKEVSHPISRNQEQGGRSLRQGWPMSVCSDVQDLPSQLHLVLEAFGQFLIWYTNQDSSPSLETNQWQSKGPEWPWRHLEKEHIWWPKMELFENCQYFAEWS